MDQGIAAAGTPGFYRLEEVGDGPSFACTRGATPTVCDQMCRDYLNITVVDATGTTAPAHVTVSMHNASYVPECRDWVCESFSTDQSSLPSVIKGANGTVYTIDGSTTTQSPHITFKKSSKSPDGDSTNCTWSFVFESALRPPNGTHLQQAHRIDYTGFYNSSLPKCRSSKPVSFSPDPCDTLLKSNVSVTDVNGLVTITQQFPDDAAQIPLDLGGADQLACYPFYSIDAIPDRPLRWMNDAGTYGFVLDGSTRAFQALRRYTTSHGMNVTCEWNMTFVGLDPPPNVYIPDLHDRKNATRPLPTSISATDRPNWAGGGARVQQVTDEDPGATRIAGIATALIVTVGVVAAIVMLLRRSERARKIWAVEMDSLGFSSSRTMSGASDATGLGRVQRQT